MAGNYMYSSRASIQLVTAGDPTNLVVIQDTILSTNIDLTTGFELVTDTMSAKGNAPGFVRHNSHGTFSITIRNLEDETSFDPELLSASYYTDKIINFKYETLKIIGSNSSQVTKGLEILFENCKLTNSNISQNLANSTTTLNYSYSGYTQGGTFNGGN